MPTITENKRMNNAIKVLTLITMFLSGVVAYHTYFRATHPDSDFVKLERTKSGQFVIKDGHIYELNELEPVPASNQNLSTYSSGASQSYQLPKGK